MAVNFRLAYNNGVEYTDLLPHTSMQNIEGTEDSLSYSTINLTIPAFTGLTQTVSYALNDRQLEAPFIVILQNRNSNTLKAYLTINQIESNQSGFVITRLGEGSSMDINVKIIFKERGLIG